MATIDTSMYGRIQPAQIESPMNMLAQASQLRQAQQQNRLAELTLGQKQREIEDDQAVRGVYAKFGTGAEALPELAKISPTAYRAEAKAQSEMAKSQREAEKAKLEATGKQLELVGQIFGPVLQNPALYPQALAQARELIPGGGKDLPDQFDPAAVQGMLQRAMSAKDQVAQIWKAKEFDLDTQKFGETKQHNRATEGIARANLGVSQANLGLRTQELTQKKTMDKETIKQNAANNQKVNDAKDVLGLLDEVDALLPKATNGALGVAGNFVAGTMGMSTEGANATAQLKALQGSLVSKMPKMTGPQSDKDVQLYREMAGQVGDPMVPRAQRQAAAATIRKLNEKYAGVPEGSSKKGGGTSTPISVANADDYAKVPSGATYIDPNGQTRRKP